MVVAAFADQGQLEIVAGEQIAGGVGPDQFEAGAGIRAGAVVDVEQWAHADQHVGGPDRALERPRHRASTRFVETAREHGGDRGRLGLVEQLDFIAQMSLVVERSIDDVLRFLGQFDQRIAEVVVLVRLDRMHVGAERQARAEAIARGRCAIQIVTLDLELERFAGRELRLLRGQVELHALGQEFFDAQGQALGRLLARRIEAELDLPASGRRIGRNLSRPFEIAEVLRFEAGFGVEAAIRLLERREQRLRLDRLAVVVAQQRRKAHGFTRAVEVAPAPGEHVEPGLAAPGNGEIGKVERRLVERHHRHVASRACDQHMLGVERVGEHRIAALVGDAGHDRVAGAIDDPDLDAADGIAGLQRGGVDEHLVLVGAGVDADVADEIEAGFLLVAEMPRLLEHGEVEARLGQLGDVLDRQVVERALVFVAGQDEAVGVDRIGDLRDRLALAAVPAVLRVEVPGAAARVLLVGGEEIGQFVVVHAQEFDIDFVDVDRNHGQATRLARRQHAALRGESDRRFERAGEDVLADLAAEGLAIHGRELALDVRGIGGIGLDERKAQGLAILVERPAAADRLAVGPAHREQAVEILCAGHLLRKLEGQGELALVHLGARRTELELAAGRLCRLGLDRFLALHLGHAGRLLAARGESQDCKHQDNAGK